MVVDPDEQLLAELDAIAGEEEDAEAKGEQLPRLSIGRVAALLRRVRQLEARTLELERQANRAAAVDELPAAAPFGALLRLRGDTSGALYLGNGPGRPLTRLLPQQL